MMIINIAINIARIANAVHCNSKLSGNKDCHEFRFSIVRIVTNVSNVTSGGLGGWGGARSCLLITLIKCLKGHKSLGSLILGCQKPFLGNSSLWNFLPLKNP